MWHRDASTYLHMLMRLALVVALLCAALSVSCRQQERQSAGQLDQAATRYSDLRKSMVDQQIIARGIKDAGVVAALLKVPRHLFVPESYRALAYSDGPLPIGAEQTISQPYIVALMSEELDLKATDKVLEIGTGSGYHAAVLAEIVSEVYTIEIIDVLGLRAEALLDSLGYSNVSVRIGDGYQGWPEHAPFDKIIVTCAPTQIPEPLVSQLKEGGLMVIPVGPMWGQYLYRVRKQDGKVATEQITPVSFVPMTGRSPATQ
jgi:protein-L-isoaspartate(D-aspartate) O-methyltransferase